MQDATGQQTHFPAVSEGPAGAAEQQMAAEQGGTTVLEEAVYAATDADYGHGQDQIGTVTIVYWKGGTSNRVPFTAYFAFDADGGDPEIAIVSGIVPGGNWDGRGQGSFNGGTGRYDGKSGSIPIKARNPKRWG